jgi:hypothetical protein
MEFHMNEINMRTLKDLMPEFHHFLETEGQQWQKEREDKDEFFARYFAEQQIDNLDEGTLRELIHILWAFNGWTNKDWLLEEMLHSGLPGIRSAFRQLLYGKDSIASFCWETPGWSKGTHDQYAIAQRANCGKIGDDQSQPTAGGSDVDYSTPP